MIRISGQEVVSWCQADRYGGEYSERLVSMHGERMEALKRVCVERHRGVSNVARVEEVVRKVSGVQELVVVVDGFPAW